MNFSSTWPACRKLAWPTAPAHLGVVDEVQVDQLLQLHVIRLHLVDHVCRRGGAGRNINGKGAHTTLVQMQRNRRPKLSVVRSHACLGLPART